MFIWSRRKGLLVEYPTNFPVHFTSSKLGFISMYVWCDERKWFYDSNGETNNNYMAKNCVNIVRTGQDKRISAILVCEWSSKSSVVRDHPDWDKDMAVKIKWKITYSLLLNMRMVKFIYSFSKIVSFQPWNGFFYNSNNYQRRININFSLENISKKKKIVPFAIRFVIREFYCVFVQQRQQMLVE